MFSSSLCILYIIYAVGSSDENMLVLKVFAFININDCQTLIAFTLTWFLNATPEDWSHLQHCLLTIDWAQEICYENRSAHAIVF